MNKKGSFLIIIILVAAVALVVGGSWLFLSLNHLTQDIQGFKSDSVSNGSSGESKVVSSNNSSSVKGVSSNSNFINCSNVSMANTSLCTNSSFDSCRLITNFEKYSFDEEVVSSANTLSIKVWVFENNAKRIVYSESELGGSVSKNWAVSDEGALSTYMSVNGNCMVWRGNEPDPEYGHPEVEYGNNDLESMALMGEAIAMKQYLTDKKTVFGGHDVLEMNAKKIEYSDQASVKFGPDAKFSFNYFSTEYCVPLQMEIFDGDYIKKTFSNIKVDNIDDSKFVFPTGCMEIPFAVIA